MMDNLDIPLPPTSSIPLPSDDAPKLVITSSTAGERSVSTFTKENEENDTKSHKKKHKKEKHKHKHKHKEKDKSKDKKKKHHPLITPEVLSQHASAIKAAMLKEVQGESKDAELSQTIVDDLFKDFLATKMNEIESAYKKAAEEQTASGDVVTSVEEMNKLLDDELDTISQNTPSPSKKVSKSGKEKSSKSEKSFSKSSEKAKKESSSVKSHYRSSKRGSGSEPPLEPLLLSPLEDIKIPKIPDFSKSSKSRSNTLISSVVKQMQSQDSTEQEQVVTVVEDKTLSTKNVDGVDTVPRNILTEKDQKEDLSLLPIMSKVGGMEPAMEGPSLPPKVEGPEPEPKVALESKKPGKLQLAFKISQTSAELISKGTEEACKKDLKLEEGEVLSSGHGSSSDSESDDEGDGEISETGSLSDSDKDQKDKSKKKKKKKKHKKKKKKHKIEKDKEKDDTESRNKRKHSSHRSRSRSKSPKKHRGSRSRSKDRRKRSRSKSFSPSHGVWRERSRSKEKKKYRSKSFSPDHGIWRSSRHTHDRDKSREKDRDKDRRHDRDKDWDHNRDHDRQKRYDHVRDNDRSRRKTSRERDHEKKDSERRYGKWRSRSRSRSKERRREKDKNKEDLRLKIDKAKLREIAMKNALAMAKSGHDAVSGVDLTAIKAGGKSIGELTEFCARIASKEKLKKNRPEGLTSSSSSDEDKSDDDSLIHHPFKVVEKNITLNIRNATPVPIMSAQEKITQQATLRLTFPVSSGNVHRTKEIEWVPVQKTETVKTQVVSATTTTVSVPTTTGASIESTAVIPTLSTEVKLMPVRDEDKVFSEPTPSHEPTPVDISAIIGERIKAARKLAENPRDSAAMSAMQKAQHNASLWATSKNLPGKFMGSTGAQILSHDELMGPDKKRQAWAKKDQFNRAAPVKSGIGMALLQKMGWQQGTGLGKNNEGGLEPLALDFKMDRKGLSSQDEYRPSKRVNVSHTPIRKDLSGKHPVSALVELCNKRRWGSPDFQMVQEGGPDHKKTFLFKVMVNGVEYSPSSASQNKKLAKAAAATAVLQEMGLVPRE